MKRTWLLFATCVLFCRICGGEETNSVSQGKIRRLLVSNAQIEANYLKAALIDLRAGRTNAVTEGLEFKIDNDICFVGGQLENLEGSAKESAWRFLKEMKAYREEHPRNIETNMIRVGVAVLLLQEQSPHGKPSKEDVRDAKNLSESYLKAVQQTADDARKILSDPKLSSGVEPHPDVHGK